MATERPNADSHSPSELTDSPWFWACVFSAMALAGTIAIAPKYEARQRQIELRFVARERSQEFTDRVAAADGDSSRVRDELAREIEVEPYDGQRELFVRLTPMLLLLSAVFLGSLLRICSLQAKAEAAPLFDRRRAVLLVLAAAYCCSFAFGLWLIHASDSRPHGEFEFSQYRAWAAGRGLKTLLIFLLSGILIALAVTQLWKKKPSTM